MFRMAFNTHLLYSSKVVFDKKMLDPDTVVKKAYFPEGFKIVLTFEDLPMDPENEECKAQLEGIDLIKRIVADRHKENLTDLDAQILTFGDPDFDDRDEMMVNQPGDEDESEASEGDEDA